MFWLFIAMMIIIVTLALTFPSFYKVMMGLSCSFWILIGLLILIVIIVAII